MQRFKYELTDEDANQILMLAARKTNDAALGRDRMRRAGAELFRGVSHNSSAVVVNSWGWHTVASHLHVSPRTSTVNSCDHARGTR